MKRKKTRKDVKLRSIDLREEKCGFLLVVVLLLVVKVDDYDRILQCLFEVSRLARMIHRRALLPFLINTAPAARATREASLLRHAQAIHTLKKVDSKE